MISGAALVFCSRSLLHTQVYRVAMGHLLNAVLEDLLEKLKKRVLIPRSFVALLNVDPSGQACHRHILLPMN